MHENKHAQRVYPVIARFEPKVIENWRILLFFEWNERRDASSRDVSQRMTRFWSSFRKAERNICDECWIEAKGECLLLFSTPGVDGEIFDCCALSAKSRCGKMLDERGFKMRRVAACTESLGKCYNFLPESGFFFRFSERYLQENELQVLGLNGLLWIFISQTLQK